MDEIEELLRRGAPEVDVDESGPAIRGVVVAVAGHRRSWPRRLKRRTAAVIGGLVLVPAVAVAGVVHFAAETGRFGQPGMTENNTSQIINLCAGDIGRYVATLYPTYQALAPGANWNQIGARYLAAQQTSCPPHGPGEETQADGIKTSLLLSGSCTWERWALNAAAADETADLSRADRQLAEIQAHVATVQQHAGADGGSFDYRHLEQRYAAASRAYLDYDYQVNCLGRDTAQNPPTVTDPDQ